MEKLRWGLAKDDVSPQDIFRMTKEGPTARAKIAKYCIQDCNLVQHLWNKIDIKLTSPDLNKTGSNEGYEGAIVLPPKCKMYMDEPVACVDYASLYPSAMISENLSHDSKVWTKEFDLDGNEVKRTGSWNKGDRKFCPFDNLEGYKYVNIEFDLYKYHSTRPGGAAQKVKCAI